MNYQRAKEANVIYQASLHARNWARAIGALFDRALRNGLTIGKEIW